MNLIAKFIVLFSFTLLLNFSVNGQQVSLITNLVNNINETSGLITVNQKLITHNDSGGEAALYEIDTLTGNYTRKVTISNATNNDWEDICIDSLYIYIADFGNNNGNRADLKIYKISITDFLNTPNDTVIADTINFNYADQSNFTPSPYTTNFDAEALISIEDSLYIFTKNWGNNWSNIYALPKTPGTYSTSKIDSINSQGLITGATYDKNNQNINLVGYTFSSAFFINISQYSSANFSNGTLHKTQLTVPASYQIEGISTNAQNTYYLTAEEHSSGSASLYKLINNSTNISNITNDVNYFYPNPATNLLYIKHKNIKLIEVYNLSGIKILQTKESVLDTSPLKKGLHLIKMINDDGNSIIQKLIIN